MPLTKELEHRRLDPFAAAATARVRPHAGKPLLDHGAPKAVRLFPGGHAWNLRPSQIKPGGKADDGVPLYALTALLIPAYSADALPPELERELLDAFDGVPRVGVPFEQTRYIPRDYREALTLDDFLRITDEWEQTDDRRCQLVEKQFRGGGRNAKENAEFAELQRLYGLRRNYRCWQRTGDANHPLIDEAVLSRLQEEDARFAQSK